MGVGGSVVYIIIISFVVIIIVIIIICRIAQALITQFLINLEAAELHI